MLLPSSSTSRTACALKSLSNRRRGRRLGVSAIGRDIVSTFRKMSTKPDQAHIRFEQRSGHEALREVRVKRERAVDVRDCLPKDLGAARRHCKDSRSSDP